MVTYMSITYAAMMTLSEEVKILQYERESSGYKETKQVKARTAVRKG
jgi:hypothetical protein